MEPKKLQQHIEERVHAGASKEAITEQLLAVGWSEGEIEKAYTDALVATGVPVPAEGARGRYGKRASTLDVVLNFFSFILLGIVATALGTLFYQIINNYFPDPLTASGGGMSTQAVYYAIAALMVAYPLYYVVMRIWFARFREDEAKMESKLTKWLTYLVMLVASVVVVGDLIAILFTFFGGELTTRFFLKALTLLVVAGMVFGFYFLERKKVQFRLDIPRRMFQIFGYILTILVVVGIVLGFIVAGSPATERMRTFDERRAEDLSGLANCIGNYAQEYARLPATLDELSSLSNYAYCNTTDPETKQQYEYQVLAPLTETSATVSEGSIELCANFSLVGKAQDVRNSYVHDKWYEHGVGRACDTERISVHQQVTAPMQITY